LGRRPPLATFGTDNEKPDGTCIRDYVHVTDLADVHMRVIDQLDHRSVGYNVGTGRGYSMMEIIASVSRIAGRRVPTLLAERRLGDPAILVTGAYLLRS
jgi:UDP-glucose 4-epimerase